MSIFKEKNTFNRVLKYIFFVIVTLRVASTFYTVYQYIWATSKQVITKWWTLVEWIFSTTSFLPYLNNDRQSKFYQWFLFDKCLDYSIESNWDIVYNDKLCHVTTRDYKTYYVNILSWDIWSDWVPFSIEDIYFTYNDIIKENKLGIPYLEKYSWITVEQEWEQVKVTFKNNSKDNTAFFTNYILPKHALLEPNKDMYQQSFAIEPIYNNCAKIKSQSTDQYSLIFDLSNCTDTNLWYYQIKNTISFDNFRESVWQLNWSIIDIYEWEQNLDWYEVINLKTNKLITLFFNTKSNKMTVRLRRSLWWFINTNFLSQDIPDEYIEKYNRDIFNRYLSTGWNLSDFLKRVSITKWLSKDDLLESWVKEYTWKISFTNKDKVFPFYTEDSRQEFTFKLNFESSYPKIWIQYNSGSDLYYPSSYNSKTKTADYTASTKNWNLWKWLNTYIIYWISWDKKDQIWTINLYNLYEQDNWWDNSSNTEKLNVLYFDDSISNYTISKLKSIFKEYWVLDNFIFTKFDDVNEMEWKLTAWDYDIVLNTIDMWLNKDISAIFGSENSTANPSQYTDARLLSLLKQYNESENKTKIIEEINSIYANDMPIVILGKQYVKLNMKTEIYNRLWIENQNLYEYNRRDSIYDKLSLTENISIDKDEIKNLKNFWRYIQDPDNY